MVALLLIDLVDFVVVSADVLLLIYTVAYFLLGVEYTMTSFHMAIIMVMGEVIDGGNEVIDGDDEVIDDDDDEVIDGEE